MLIVASVSAATETAYESPAALVRALDDAYRRGDISAVMAARDYREEARRRRQYAGWAGIGENELAGFLKADNWKILTNLTLPRFKKARCQLLLGNVTAEEMIQIQMHCADAAQMPQEDLFAVKRADGWRAIALAADEKP
jgi:hypothetical protein